MKLTLYHIMIQRNGSEDLKEKAILIGLELPENHTGFEESMNELEHLAHSAGAKVELIATQSLSRVLPTTYIGAGKVEEIKELIQAHDIDLAIFNNELSGSQLKNLEDQLGVKIVDRTNLILDIFATRARSTESVLQVELAQAKYRLPRLAGFGNYLSRLGGGIGTRGPGEQQIETDRRHIRRQISNIEKRLDKQEGARSITRKRRQSSSVPVVSLLGYTNVGKSTIMNRLLATSDGKEEKRVYADDLLFATLETSHRRIDPPEGQPFILSDTVGLIRDLPIDLVEAFQSTLEEVIYADLILVVLDASAEDLDRQFDTINDTLENLKAGDIPVAYVYNKIDLTENVGLIAPKTRRDNSIYISALEDEGIKELLKLIEDQLNLSRSQVEVEIPYTEAALISSLIDKYNPEKSEGDWGMKMTLYLNDKEKKDLEEYKI